MTSIRGKAGDLLANFERIACGGLFETLPIETHNEGYGVAVQEMKNKAAMVSAFVGTPDGIVVHPAKPHYVVSSAEFLKYLGIFEAQQDIAIFFSGTEVNFEGPNDKATIYPDAKPPETNPVLVGKCAAALNGNLAWKKAGDAPEIPGATPTLITIEAAQLQAVVKKAKTNESDDYFIEFAEPGVAKATLIRPGAKQNRVASSLIGAQVKGPPVGVVLAKEEFVPVVQALKGTVQLQATQGFPLVVVNKTDKASFVYIITQRK